MRTAQELYDYVTNGPGNDVFGFALEATCEFMPFDVVGERLREGVDKDEWDKGVIELNRENVLARLTEYMATYGWPKCQDHRGISASRTIMKVSAWLYAMEFDPKEVTREDYAPYGAPMLARVCERLGLPIPQDEETQRMISGQDCMPGCEEGCNS